MSKTKIFCNYVTNKFLSNFNGQLLSDTEIKGKFSSLAGGIDCILRVDKTVLMMAFKWDNGVMSVNNINQFLRATNVVSTNITQTHPDRKYNYIKVLVTKKPVVYPNIIDEFGNKKFFNICLNQEDISDVIPDDYEGVLMERVAMKLYNNISETVNQSPGIKEDNGDIMMAYFY